MLHQGKAVAQVETIIEVAIENPELTMDNAEEQLRLLGNNIVTRDDERRTFVVAHTIDR